MYREFMKLFLPKVCSINIHTKTIRGELVPGTHISEYILSKVRLLSDNAAMRNVINPPYYNTTTNNSQSNSIRNSLFSNIQKYSTSNNQRIGVDQARCRFVIQGTEWMFIKNILPSSATSNSTTSTTSNHKNGNHSKNQNIGHNNNTSSIPYVEIRGSGIELFVPISDENLIQAIALTLAEQGVIY